MKLISQKALIRKYLILGHFYNVTAGDDVICNCRSVLEIVGRGNLPKDLRKLSSSVPDALFIMMNPGLCESEESNLEQIDIENYTIDFINKR